MVKPLTVGDTLVALF